MTPPREPQRGKNWPFPRDSDSQAKAARRHRKEQRRAVLDLPKGLF